MGTLLDFHFQKEVGIEKPFAVVGTAAQAALISASGTDDVVACSRFGVRADGHQLSCMIAAEGTYHQMAAMAEQIQLAPNVVCCFHLYLRFNRVKGTRFFPMKPFS